MMLVALPLDWMSHFATGWMSCFVPDWMSRSATGVLDPSVTWEMNLHCHHSRLVHSAFPTSSLQTHVPALSSFPSEALSVLDISW